MSNNEPSVVPPSHVGDNIPIYDSEIFIQIDMIEIAIHAIDDECDRRWEELEILSKKPLPDNDSQTNKFFLNRRTYVVTESKFCLNPNHYKPVKTRGLCSTCYSLAVKLVNEGKTTYAKLEAQGKIHPVVKSSQSSREWLLEDSSAVDKKEFEAA